MPSNNSKYTQELRGRTARHMPLLEEKYYRELRCRTQHRKCQYLNNIVEQDHRFIKRKTNQMLGLRATIRQETQSAE